MKRLYVVGPMSGVPRFNYPAFADAQGQLEAAGYEVRTPIDGDSPEIQEIAWASQTGDPAELPDGFLVEAVRRNTEDVLACDGIALLDGWQSSSGARHEVELANRLGLPSAPVWLWVEAAGGES